MSTIGIVGAGIAGLQLGLFLRSAGVDTTIYTAKDAAGLQAARMSNMVIRSAPTRERERRLGVAYWDDLALDLGCMRVRIAGARQVEFCGRFERPAQAVDLRVYCARLLSEFAHRGGHVVTGTVERDDVERLAGTSCWWWRRDAAGWPVCFRAWSSTRRFVSRSAWCWAACSAASIRASSPASTSW